MGVGKIPWASRNLRPLRLVREGNHPRLEVLYDDTPVPHLEEMAVCLLDERERRVPELPQQRMKDDFDP